MAHTQVRCNARNCAHWLPGDLCSAGVIEVEVQGSGPPRGGPGDTLCATFAHRRGLGQVLLALDNFNWADLAEEPFRPDVQTSPEVRCRVRACLFHDGSGRCRADGIQVSGEGATLPEETNCSTYLPRS